MAMRAVMIVLTLALVVAACARVDAAPRCDVHDRTLIARRTTIDTTTYCGIPIDGYAAAHAASFPNTFRRPTLGEHGADATAEHCLACTLARATWLDDRFGQTLTADRDGFVDVIRSVDADTRAVSEALDGARLARGAPVVARHFDGVNGYARLGDADVGVTEVWWNRTPVADRTDVAVRTSPHDEAAARALIDALAAEAAR